MRLIIRVSAVVALLLTIAPAVALAVPVLSGQYILSGSANCQAILSVTKDPDGKVTGVNITNGGSLNGIAVAVTFTPATGRAVVSGTGVDGDLLLMQGLNSGSVLEQHAVSEDWAYSNTATTVTLNGIVYRAKYGKVTNNIVQSAVVVGREDGNRCVFNGILMHR